jgi:23S rRNA (guanosine2251-2'-O)-methyltransferase
LKTPRKARPGASTASRPSARRAGSQDLLYGRNAVREVLRAGRRRCFELWLAAGLGPDDRLTEILQRAGDAGIPVREVTRDWLDERVAGGHQGVALLASTYPYSSAADLAALAADGAPLLALDQLEDPRNVGALLRTAEATGVGLVALPADRAAGITPSVVNASAGATELLQIARVTNLARWLDTARLAGYWIVGLALDERAQPLLETWLPRPTVLVVGSEGRGLRRLVAESCDLLAYLPMAGQIESLNAAVAGSIALYELRQQAHADDVPSA